VAEEKDDNVGASLAGYDSQGEYLRLCDVGDAARARRRTNSAALGGTMRPARAGDGSHAAQRGSLIKYCAGGTPVARLNRRLRWNFSHL